MIEALGFLTITGRARRPSPAAVSWFPLAGTVVGLAVGTSWWVAGEIWSPAVAAAVVVAVDLALTGLLHLDGLADSADGLLPHLSRERRLAVMAEPTVGAFALGVVPVVLLLRWAALASLEPDVLLVAGLWCASRTLMAVALSVLPYARAEGGLASAFLGADADGADLRTPGPVALATALIGGNLALVLVALGSSWAGAFGFAAAVVAGLLVLELARVRLGGHTGDVLGATGLVAETAGLLVAAAW
ncbi:MAG TPA: adenosylcobinamide-GDP ribazoletransferase [Acidimicrobiales bacterium]|nr:adenosylcobinamide-GDP ribazoletransferase [Acidimicrobiales bacterium]